MNTIQKKNGNLNGKKITLQGILIMVMENMVRAYSRRGFFC
jgi:hypothetical protein